MRKPAALSDDNVVKTRKVEKQLVLGMHASWIAVLAIIFISFLALDNLDVSLAFTIVGGAISFSAWGLTLLIARAQDDQLRNLTVVATDTKITAHKLQTDSVLEEEGVAFFNLGAIPANDAARQYRCYRTAKIYDSSQDLPFTPVAEDFCIQEMQKVFGACKRSIYLENVDADSNSDEQSAGRVPHHLNVIFMRSADITRDFVDPAHLPCWFRNGEIVSGERRQVLNANTSEMSIGILGRLRHGDQGEGRLILMQGKNQAGTWIVGQFFADLMARANWDSIPNNVREDLATGNSDDLIVVVSGKFDLKTYRVQGKASILALWRRVEGEFWKESILGDTFQRKFPEGVGQLRSSRG